MVQFFFGCCNPFLFGTIRQYDTAGTSRAWELILTAHGHPVLEVGVENSDL